MSDLQRLRQLQAEMYEYAVRVSTVLELAYENTRLMTEESRQNLATAVDELETLTAYYSMPPTVQLVALPDDSTVI